MVLRALPEMLGSSWCRTPGEAKAAAGCWEACGVAWCAVPDELSGADAEGLSEPDESAPAPLVEDGGAAAISVLDCTAFGAWAGDFVKKRSAIHTTRNTMRMATTLGT